MNLFKFKIINEPVKLQTVLLIFKRYKSKDVSLKYSPCTKALNYFDDFYKAIFIEKWPSVRLALLSKQKYLAVINNFGDVAKTEEFLKAEGAFDLRQFLEAQKNFTKESEVKSSETVGGNRIEDVITHQIYEEEEKEAQLHPEGMGFMAKVNYVNQKNEEVQDDYVYKPEDARTSIESDLCHAEIETSRLILPNSIQQANLNEFIPATKLRGASEFIAESDYYKYYQPKIKIPITIQEEHELDFPENLKVYCFDRGDVSDLPDPNKNLLEVYNYLNVDGAEFLAALVLGVQSNDTVLDLCSTSGNIPYCIFQSLRPKFLVCSADKFGETEKLFSQYLIDFSSHWNEMFLVTSNIVDEIEYNGLFDKVLVNVPSTDDRKSLFDTEDNYFHVLKTRSRLNLPQLQCNYLTRALKLVKPGGVVVYTVSTLCPIQTDGVVNRTLTTLYEEEKEEFTVINLTPALRHTSLLFNYGDYLNLKFGTMVVPFVPSNFGPRYICKIVKNKRE